MSNAQEYPSKNNQGDTMIGKAEFYQKLQIT